MTTYLLGMSHAISVLRAAAPDIGISHHSWAGHSAEPGFAAMDVPGLPDLRVHLIPPNSGWRAVIQHNNGQRTVAASPGFIELLDHIEAKAPGQARLLSFLGGNEHSSLSLLAHPQPYDATATRRCATATSRCPSPSSRPSCWACCSRRWRS